MPVPVAKTIVYDAGTLGADLAAVEKLARPALAARRLGRAVRIRHASAELEALLLLAGLADVLGVEPRGQPEKREDRLGVEEERELDDPSA